MIRFEYVGDLEKLVHRSPFLLLRCLVDMMRCFSIGTPLDPCYLLVRSAHHPIPLRTWSRQGLVANALRTRGHEPLRSASPRLGLVTFFCFGNPGHQLVVGPSSGWHCLQNPLGYSATPRSLLGRNFLGL